MDQNLGRAALNLLPKTGEFLFENLAACPFPQRVYIKNIILRIYICTVGD